MYGRTKEMIIPTAAIISRRSRATARWIKTMPDDRNGGGSCEMHLRTCASNGQMNEMQVRMNEIQVRMNPNAVRMTANAAD